MGMAYITDFGSNGRKWIKVQDGDGAEYYYDQGEGVEEPTPVHADLVWFKHAEKREIRYEGDKVPDVLIIRDGGGPPLSHYYHKRKA